MSADEKDISVTVDELSSALDQLNRLVQQFPSKGDSVAGNSVAGNSVAGNSVAVGSVACGSAAVESNNSPTLSERIRVKLLRWVLGEQLFDVLHASPQLFTQTVQALNEVRELASLKKFEGQEFIRRDQEEEFARCHRAIDLVRSEQSLGQQRMLTLEQHILQLDAVCRGLESIVARAKRAKPTAEDEVSTRSVVSEASESVSPAELRSRSGIDYSYLLLENRFRGSEDVVRSRLQEYLPIFAECTLPIFEIGAGRGELQVLFHEAGLPSYGVELDAAMVEVCREKNLDVRLDDGIAHLRSLEDGALGGLIAIQVIEHLPLALLEELLSLASRKLEVGGVLVLETINTSSLLALAHNYFRDPTHSQPLHPDTMRFLAEQSGLVVSEVRPRSAYPVEAQLQRIEEQVYYPERWRPVIAGYNHTIETLNSIIFGFQDYALVAHRR